jgi:hypothetical protein
VGEATSANPRPTAEATGAEPAGEPDVARVRHFLLYSLSLPERALRSATGLVGGTLRESCDLLVPQAFRSGRTYSILVQQMLDFLAEDVGGVQRKAAAQSGSQIENYVARKAVANFIDLAGLATLHLSPMLLLAVTNDVAYGSQSYLRELADELKRQGVIAADSTVDHVDDLLAAVGNAAGTTALAFAVPPLTVEGLKKTIEDTRAAVRSIDAAGVLPQAETRRLWEEIHEVATSQGVSPLAISSAMTLYSLGKVGTACRGALSSVTVAGRLLDRLVLAHYERALAEIRSKGLYRCLAETGKPYVAAVWRNFSSQRTTLTEDLLSGKLFGRLGQALRRCLRVRGKP